MQIWHNDVLVKSSQLHNGAVFSISKSGKWLFTGGWDKTISMLVRLNNKSIFIHLTKALTPDFGY